MSIILPDSPLDVPPGGWSVIPIAPDLTAPYWYEPLHLDGCELDRDTGRISGTIAAGETAFAVIRAHDAVGHLAEASVVVQGEEP